MSGEGKRQTAREAFLREVAEAMDGDESEVIDRILTQMGMTVVRLPPPRRPYSDHAPVRGGETSG